MQEVSLYKELSKNLREILREDNEPNQTLEYCVQKVINERDLLYKVKNCDRVKG